MKNITDKQASTFVGVTDRALRLWKAPKVLENGTKFYPATGKHNLYQGAKLITYLLDYKDTEEVNFNKLEILSSNVEELFNILEIACKNNKYKEQIMEMISNIKQITEEIDNVCSLSSLK